MNDSKFLDSVDERRRQQFENDWIQSKAGKIEDYLPDPTDSLYLGTLEELVHIDLEFRWKRFARDAAQSDRPEPIESYLETYSELRQPLIFKRLVQAEFELRWRSGDQPSEAEYRSRFADWETKPVDVAGMLETVRQQLSASETRRKQRLEPGTQLGRYKLVAEHGRGGFGAVWRADDTKMGRRIALKRLGSNLARQAESRRRFISEARVTARLEHPGIVPVYDMSNLEDDHAYYTMKLVRGETLAEKIAIAHGFDAQDGRRAVAEKNLLRSFLDVCYTIDYCHSRGVLHRDIKPQNVVVGNFGETIVLDWGLASVIVESEQEVEDEAWVDEQILSAEESVETLRGTIKGTPAYMPPEQASGEIEKIDRRSDIYSLGAMLFHILAGRPAFSGQSLDSILGAVKVGHFPTPKSLNSQVDHPIQAICLKAMQTDPTARYQTVEELSNDVESYLAEEPVTVYRDPLRVRVQRWTRKNRALAATAACLVLVLLGITSIGLVQNSLARQREAKRLAQVRENIVRAEQAGLIHLEESEYESALQFFQQAHQLAAEEQALVDLRDRLGPRIERLTRVVEAYELAEKAQEHLFMDRIAESAIYAQAAIQRTGAHLHADWWNHLETQDFSPEQKEHLQFEVYRLYGMLATMRFAELAPENFSFEWLSGLIRFQQNVEATEKINAAWFAASRALNFRPSNTLESIMFLTHLIRFRPYPSPFPIEQPTNSSDAAMLGTILDIHISDEPEVMKVLMGDQNPENAAEVLLLNGISSFPDWYWLTVMVGQNQILDGEYFEAIRTLSHGVGIDQQGWLAYILRAYAYVLAAQETDSESQKTLFQKNARMDVLRAESIQPYHPDLAKFKGDVLSYIDYIEPTCLAYLESIMLSPRISEIDDPHLSKVTKDFVFQSSFIDYEEKNYQHNQVRYLESTRMAAAALLWIGEPDLALKKVKQALEIQEHDPVAKLVEGMILLSKNSRDPAARQQVHDALKHKSANYWRGHLDLAAAYELNDEIQSAIAQYQLALEQAKTDWQTAMTHIALVRCYSQTAQPESARDHFRAATQADLAVDLTGLGDLIEDDDLKLLIEQHQQYLEPFSQIDQTRKDIVRPALLNGDFELKLFHGWAEFDLQSSRIWKSEAGYWSEAERVKDAYSGEFALHIQSGRQAEETGQRSLMVQQFPVTPGVRYQVSCWAKAKDLQENSLGIFQDPENPEPLISFPAGDFGWTNLRNEFVAEEKLVTLAIICQDSGSAWLDDIRVEAIR